MPAARILVVDDEDLVRDYFGNALTTGGYEVDLAATAERAYALLAERDYALVIADWWLDDGNGLSIANEASSRGAKTFISSGFDLELLGENAERHRLGAAASCGPPGDRRSGDQPNRGQAGDAPLMAAWLTAAIIAAIAAVGVTAAFLRDRRHPAGTPAGGRYSRSNIRPEDPLHQRAKHYLASGALPRWDP